MPGTIEDNLTIADLLKHQRAVGKMYPELAIKLAQASMEDRVNPWEAMPMILIEHRWMKNRNVVVGSTVIAFDGQGIAKIRDAGNARYDCETYIRSARGLAKIVDPQKTAEDLPVAIAPDLDVKMTKEEAKEARAEARAEAKEDAALIAEQELAQEIDEQEHQDAASVDAEVENDADKATPRRRMPPKGKR